MAIKSEPLQPVKVWMHDFIYEDYKRYLATKGLKLVSYPENLWENPEVAEYLVTF